TDYPAGELTKSVTKDENWSVSDALNKTTEEFKNKNGQVILKRTYNGGQAHDTYYVYDDYGNLTYVLPPKAEADTTVPTSTVLSELCYQYKYDSRNRLVAKKIPGKGWESIIYDKLDRPVMTQDAVQATNDEWLVTKYDQLGRVAYTGIYDHGSSSTRIAMQSSFDTQNDLSSELYEQWTSASGPLGIYYSNANFPVNNLEVLTVNYYDNYAFNREGAGTSVVSYGVTSTSNTKGLATGSRVRVLGRNTWVVTVSYYDERARPIYVYSKNTYLGTTDIVKSKLDFTGRVEETTSTHVNINDTANGTHTLIDVMTYDHAGRLLTQTQNINGASTTEVIVSNHYDELGQLESKGVGGLTTASRLQTVDYTYNVRGWLTNINQDAQNDNDLFNFSLRYNNPTSGTALYNGNISQTSWNTLNTDTSTRTYTYSYDALNRIISGMDNTGNYKLEEVQYDKNGNITYLNREGAVNSAATVFDVMDELDYFYQSNSNKLIKVTDGGSSQFGFKDGTNTGNDYTYDVNGNMITDANKGITNITYNHLNLPTQVTIGSNNIYYVYDASGVKLRKTVQSTTTDYAGNFIYENNDLQFFNHAEGYVKHDGTNGYEYVYQYKDHLGNVRLSYTDADNNGSINASTEIIEESNYYPFGLKHRGYNYVTSSNGNSVAQKWGFTGKEHQDELGLGWIDITARNYDAALGRWMNLDPLAEKMRRHSPYNYAFDNPIYYIDPDGMAPSDWVNKKGQKIYDPKLNGGEGGYTEHATHNDKVLGNNLKKSGKTGEAQFQKLVTSEAKITIEMDMSSKVVKSKNGEIQLGVTDSQVVTGSDFKTGEVMTAKTIKSNIKINFGSIDAVLQQDNPEAIFKGLDFNEILAIVLGHEIEHTTDENALTSATGGNKEEKPNEVGKKISDEIKTKKNEEK
ncbi:MAG: RHS repeat-associated core domain-containing protein, partial [Flavobacteriaceae bacterium]